MAFITWPPRLALALFGVCISAQVQSIKTEGLWQVLADSERIGDPSPRAQSEPLWIRAISTIPVSLDGFIVIQRGKQLPTLDRTNFDPHFPFCVVAPDVSASAGVDADPEIAPGQQLQANIIGMQPNSIDLGPYHLSTDLLRIRLQRSGSAVVLGFMWPREAGSLAPVRRGALVGELHEILGSKLQFGKGWIPVPEYPKGLVFTADSSLVQFEVLIRDRRTMRPISNVRLDQFRVFEGCAPEVGPSCKPVNSLRMATAEERAGTTNFIVLPEIGGALSHSATIQSAVSRLVDFTNPGDRAAIVPYYQTAVVWQPLTSDKDVYKRRASELFEANVGSRHVIRINTYGAVTTALNDVASGEPDQRNVILLITEGHDCFNPYQLAKMAAERNTSIWVMDLTGKNQLELKPLAEMSGGLYFRVNTYDVLMTRIEEFVGTWKKVYFLSYQANGAEAGVQVPRREIRVVDVGDVALTVSKGFRGPQVVANMYNPETANAPSSFQETFGKVRAIGELVALIHQIGSDSDFVGFSVRAIGISTSVGEFFTFLEHIDHVATLKRQKTIGHLITSNVHVFARMKPSANEWLRLRARVVHAEDWIRMTEFFLPTLQRAEDFLQALEVRSPDIPGFSNQTNHPVVGEIAFAHLQQFREMKPTAPQIEAYVALLDKRRRIPVLLALGVRSIEQLAPELRSTFEGAKDAGESLSLLDDLLRSTTEPQQFWTILKIYSSTGRPDAEFVAGQAVLHSLKTLASFPAPGTMIPEALKWGRNASEKLSVLRELNGSLPQINELKNEAEDDSSLVSIYEVAISKAHSVDELIMALQGPSHPRFAKARDVRDHMIEAQLRQFGKKATTPEQYFALCDETDTIYLKRRVLSTGLSELADSAARERLKIALQRIKNGPTENGGVGK